MSMQIDNGELAGIKRRECFLLGYEYATITMRIKLGFAFDALVHADNAARIEAFCEEVGAAYAMEWNKGDSSEQWKLFEFNGFREN